MKLPKKKKNTPVVIIKKVRRRYHKLFFVIGAAIGGGRIQIRQLNGMPLCFSAGKARRFLAQRQIAQSQIFEHFQPLMHNL